MRGHILLCAVGLSLALGAPDACAAGIAPGAAIQTSSSPVLHDLDLAAPAANSEDPALALSSAPAVSSADATAVPELPTWAMMFLCFLGLGVAMFKRGRKNRLSPGIE
jgi:hypothetical protein